PAGPEGDEAPAAATKSETPPPADQNDETAPSTEAPADADEPFPSPDVHRHRPGACPEGPPCKDDDEDDGGEKNE
ncbi:MAG TPA: hypothetical protein VNJ31_12355, partial [Methyloceanibacter sp.]|nr:hypothetical protein [Methyloceanibacter sp.]